MRPRLPSFELDEAGFWGLELWLQGLEPKIPNPLETWKQVLLLIDPPDA